MDKDYLRKKIYILFFCGALIVAGDYIVTNVFFDAGSWVSWWVANGFHFFGGFYAFFFLRAVFIYTKDRHRIFAVPWMESLILVCGALVLGVVWEWYELLIDRYRLFVFGLSSIMTYADNIGDLMIDTCGAVLAAVISEKNRTK